MIHLITGGQRCGKSEYAEKLILQQSENPIYLATSRVWDEQHKKRIDAHKARRGEQWTNIEEEKQLSKHNFSNRYILLDCITLWLNNLFFDNGEEDEKIISEAKAELDAIFSQDCNWIIVSNELGLGGHPGNKMAMRFNDIQGTINQYIAKRADLVTLVVAGIPVEIKNTQ
jgi:adenosylcobinamide kinase/adenosylcobinamide-phosphate guanylyltransferase